MRKTVMLVAAFAVAMSGGAIALGSAPAESPKAPWNVGAWSVSLSGGNAPSIAADERIVLVGKVRKFTFIDVGKKGESVGDYFLIREALFDGRDNWVGRQVYRCMLQFLPDLQCDGSYVLRGRGEITFATTVNTAQEPPLAAPITGGDGEFANVGGQVLVEVEKDRSINTLQILRFD